MSKHLFHFWLFIWLALSVVSIKFSMQGQMPILNWIIICFVMPILVFYQSPYYYGRRLLSAALKRDHNQIIVTDMLLRTHKIMLDDIYAVHLDEYKIIIERHDSRLSTVYLLEDLSESQVRYIRRIFTPAQLSSGQSCLFIEHYN
ncbi:hypothetical protein HR060_13430 [Catenovulum sp. SM1970]|uniref:hypothetical protein n=1 Tax=Marinifaba aquimaris TaxID=2741323 RepID=UPI0015735591|nr:hypothetical protein [Marinifaba aquimaris]NTS77856.1 hypothetical protein [Marinifaba aquimaris]